MEDRPETGLKTGSAAAASPAAPDGNETLSERPKAAENQGYPEGGEERDSRPEESFLPRTSSGEVDLVRLIEQPEWKTMLLDLVRSEKMDPWNIDIAKLADKYLEKINSLKGTDLRLPANAILASAILLRFKSRVLRLMDIDEDLDLQERMEKEHLLIDQELPELTVIRKVREGKVTLDELVESIERMLEKSKSRKGRAGLEERPEFRFPLMLTNIDEKIKAVMKLVMENIDSTGMVLFSRLAEGRGAMEIVDIFIPLLFLNNRGKVNVWQDEFFGEVFVSLATEDKKKS